jgi:antitoxin component of RelBE/YafQ-DinJ toxin-antitoxin module
MRKKKARSKVLTLRLTEGEHLKFQRIADKLGLSISAAIRLIMLQRES